MNRQQAEKDAEAATKFYFDLPTQRDIPTALVIAAWVLGSKLAEGLGTIALALTEREKAQTRRARTGSYGTGTGDEFTRTLLSKGSAKEEVREE